MPQGTESLAREAQEATKTILVVEDDLAIASFLVAAIEQETPYRAIMATDSQSPTPSRADTTAPAHHLQETI
jgi:hypothetical protein